MDAASVALIPDADATLIGIAPTNSMGGIEWIIAGTTQNYTSNRALMRFDITNLVPAGSKIISASLIISANKQSGEAPVGVTYGLHRMLKSWGEGTNTPPRLGDIYLNPGFGSPAQVGDATWTHRFSFTNAWAAGGGAENNEFAATPSSTIFIDSLGTYEIEVTGETIADVQFWLDHPESNFGWMFKSEDERQNFSARRFISREYPDPSLAPTLAINYLPRPVILSPRLTNGAVEFSFDADAGGLYSVEAKTTLAATNAWSTVTNFGFVIEPSQLTARIPTNSTQRFIRVRVD